jgi:hypothetical protein
MLPMPSTELGGYRLICWENGAMGAHQFIGDMALS